MVPRLAFGLFRAAALMALPSLAHHSFAAYDLNQTRTLKRHCRANPPNIIRASKRTSRKTVNKAVCARRPMSMLESSSSLGSWYSTTYVKFKSSFTSQPISKTLLRRQGRIAAVQSYYSR
jgi:hypothetical protein